MTYETVIFDLDGSVATITMNRPDAANALSLAMAKELGELAIRCDEDPAIRAVVITGAGRFFSAGGDIAGFAAAGEGVGALIKEMTMHFHAAVSRFNRMDPPVVGAVNGMAAGAGFSFASSCDILIAAESAVFLSAYTASGLTPDGSSTYFVPRLVGLRRALDLMIDNRRLTAREAMEWGMVSQVVPDEDLMTTARELAVRLADGPTKAFGAVKRMLHASLSSSLETQMELEARTIAEVTKTSDAREGVAAFLDKRKPNFTGD